MFAISGAPDRRRCRRCEPGDHRAGISRKCSSGPGGGRNVREVSFGPIGRFECVVAERIPSGVIPCAGYLPNMVFEVFSGIAGDVVSVFE